MAKSIIQDNFDLLGERVVSEKPIRDKYVEPPFSVIDGKSGQWQNRKRLWAKLGIKSEIGRTTNSMDNTKSFSDEKYGNKKKLASESIFDPALCEIMYNWYCPDGGIIHDGFAGGSVRGIVANYLGYKYTGIDIRQEQIDSNYEQGRKILGDNCPNWICGDSNKVLDTITEQCDFVFSCPPYADLEVYSDLEDDISNKDYSEFLRLYSSIIRKQCLLLKEGGFAAYVVGEVRNKVDGGYYGFVPDTVTAFKNAGMLYYNEVTFLNPIGTAMLRVGNTFDKGDGKLVKVHQNVLIFKKPKTLNENFKLV